MKRIHINNHVLRRNKREGRNDPPITIKEGKTNTYAQIEGPSELVYSPDEPMKCGAVLWIETESEIICT